jgi:hypothetical protein
LNEGVCTPGHRATDVMMNEDRFGHPSAGNRATDAVKKGSVGSGHLAKMLSRLLTVILDIVPLMP